MKKIIEYSVIFLIMIALSWFMYVPELVKEFGLLIPILAFVCGIYLQINENERRRNEKD